MNIRRHKINKKLFFANNFYEYIKYPTDGIISYAQNFEDVILWRTLWDIKNGFYIDVGAWHPVKDSVSKAFYLKGWRGLHVEPLAEYAELIRKDRPDEFVFQVLLGQKQGFKNFYYIPNTGLSTCLKEYSDRHKLAGWDIQKRTFPVITLSDIFNKVTAKDIHWLKIDVEGMECEVLNGWNSHPYRPWIIVIESTEPLTNLPNWKSWHSKLINLNYKFVYFDGLNRFYLHEKYLYLKKRLAVPPNIFDKYTKNI